MLRGVGELGVKEGGDWGPGLGMGYLEGGNGMFTISRLESRVGDSGGCLGTELWEDDGFVEDE